MIYLYYYDDLHTGRKSAFLGTGCLDTNGNRFGIMLKYRCPHIPVLWRMIQCSTEQFTCMSTHRLVWLRLVTRRLHQCFTISSLALTRFKEAENGLAEAEVWLHRYLFCAIYYRLCRTKSYVGLGYLLRMTHYHLRRILTSPTCDLTRTQDLLSPT